MTEHLSGTIAEEPIFAELIAEQGNVVEDTRMEIRRAEEAWHHAAVFDLEDTEADM